MSDHNIDARRKYQREYYARNRERVNAHRREYRLAHPPHQDPEYRRAYLYRLYYGITIADYDRLFASQGGKCAICKKSPEQVRRRRFDVDHDHKTGQVRGLLCFPCNIAVGQIEKFKGWEYLGCVRPAGLS